MQRTCIGPRESGGKERWGATEKCRSATARPTLQKSQIFQYLGAQRECMLVDSGPRRARAAIIREHFARWFDARGAKPSRHAAQGLRGPLRARRYVRASPRLAPIETRVRKVEWA